MSGIGFIDCGRVGFRRFLNIFNVLIMMAETVNFYLYHTLGCHLCDDAEELVQAVASHLQLSYKKVDIADDDSLVDKYGVRIPVLFCLKNNTELDWPFDAEKALSFMELK